MDGYGSAPFWPMLRFRPCTGLRGPTPSCLFQMWKPRQPKEGEALSPAESQARPLRWGRSSPRRPPVQPGILRRERRGPHLELPLSPSSRKCPGMGEFGHWKSQPGSQRLGKGQALEINHSLQLGSGGGGWSEGVRRGREPGEQELPSDTPGW